MFSTRSRWRRDAIRDLRALEDCLEQSERQVRDGAQHPDPANRATAEACRLRPAVDDGGLSSAHDTDTLASRQLACSEPSLLSHRPGEARQPSVEKPSPRLASLAPPHSPFVHNRTDSGDRRTTPRAILRACISPAASPPPPAAPTRPPRRAHVGTSVGPLLVVALSGAGCGSGPEGMGMASGDAMGLTVDSTRVTVQVRAILEHRWYLESPTLAPFDPSGWYPSGETVHFLLIHLIGLFADSSTTVSAVYFFLGFPLAALTMYWLMRQAGIGRLGSVVGGSSSQSCRAMEEKFGHLWLSSYWVSARGLARAPGSPR